MNTLSHILRTDLRQFRMLIAVFVVLALAETALEIALPILAGDTRLGLSLATASSLVWITIVLFNVLLVGVIVQAHALVGSDAFWMTRPFPPRTLLLSKVAVIALLLIGLPVLCNIGVMILYQVPPGRIATVAIHSILLRAVFLVFLMSAASLTRNVAGLALLCGGALLAFALTIVISAMVMRARMEDEVAMLAVNVSPLAVSGHDSTADVLVLLLLIAAGVLLLLVQYRTRLRRLSVPAGAAAIAVAFGIASIWPWPILQARVSVPDWAGTNTVLLSARPATFYFDRHHEWVTHGRRWRAGRARVTLENASPGWEAQVRVASSAITLSDGTRLEGRAVPYSQAVALNATEDVPRRTVMRAVLGVQRVAGLFDGGPAQPILIVVPDSDFQAHSGKSGDYHGTFRVDLSRVDIAASLPLERGAGYRDGAESFIIDDVRQGESVSLRVRSSGASTMFDRGAPRHYEYYLRNKRLSQATATWTRPALQSLLGLGFVGFGSASHVPTGMAFGFGVHAAIVEHRLSNPFPDDAVAIDDQWIADADLVIVRVTQSGSVVKTLEASGFTIQERPAKSQPETP
jgi:hypothetical protein